MSENLKCILGLVLVLAPFACLFLYSAASMSSRFTRMEEQHKLFRKEDRHE